VSEIELILTALMAGAAAGTTAAAQSAVMDAYTSLRNLLRGALTRRGRSDEVLDAVEAEPGTWQTELGEALTDAHADQDQQVLVAARTLLNLADPIWPQAGKYHVDSRAAKGVQVGDNNTQHNTFS
jgi:hypothetical protein